MTITNTSRYYVKDCQVAGATVVRKDFRHSALPLDFFDRVFFQQRSQMEKGGADTETQRAADYAAACIAQFQEARLLNVDAIEKALEYCEDLILDSGFRQTPVDKLHEGTSHLEDHAILVPGCQTKPHYKSRVRALVHVLNGAHFPFKVVFSGKHPPAAKSVQTPDEALALNVYFDDIGGRTHQFSKHLRRQIYLERESGTTSQNIVKFMQEPDLIAPDRPSQILLISSLYHLPRLAVALEDYIKRIGLQCVRRIVLVSAENTTPNRVSKDPLYVKQMFYEVFLHILRGRTSSRVSGGEDLTV